MCRVSGWSLVRGISSTHCSRRSRSVPPVMRNQPGASPLKCVVSISTWHTRPTPASRTVTWSLPPPRRRFPSLTHHAGGAGHQQVVVGRGKEYVRAVDDDAAVLKRRQVQRYAGVPSVGRARPRHARAAAPRPRRGSCSAARDDLAGAVRRRVPGSSRPSGKRPNPETSASSTARHHEAVDRPEPSRAARPRSARARGGWRAPRTR